MIGRIRQRSIITTSPQSARTHRSYRHENSPNKAATSIKTDCSDYINALKTKKENYATAIGLHSAFHENSQPQKCLKHLNFVTLYCTDEHRLLCVNCLYGSTAHKNHSVLPSNSSIEEIKKDNERKLKELTEEIENVRNAETMVNENHKTMLQHSNSLLHEISAEFAEIRKMFDVKEKDLKERATAYVERAVK
jgi:hypothetical protein